MIDNDGAYSAEMQWLHLELLRITDVSPVFAETRHGYGEINPAAGPRVPRPSCGAP